MAFFPEPKPETMPTVNLSFLNTQAKKSGASQIAQPMNNPTYHPTFPTKFSRFKDCTCFISL